MKISGCSLALLLHRDILQKGTSWNFGKSVENNWLLWVRHGSSSLHRSHHFDNFLRYKGEGELFCWNRPCRNRISLGCVKKLTLKFGHLCMWFV
jgi:hypothetical protein